MNHVKPGQLWEDMDPRDGMGRTLRVVSVGGDVMNPTAICVVETHRQPQHIGARRAIKVSRMKPGSRGYRLIEGEQMSKTIRVFTQPSCQPCRAVKRWLDKRGISYETVDITQSPQDAEAIRALGYTATPVTVVSTGDPETDLHWAGFHPGYLERYCGKDAA
jgi:glutaredoxin-like protein NrdH